MRIDAENVTAHYNLALTEHRRLGIHTEMFSDGLVDLFEAGVVTNEKKTLHRGKIVTSFVIGTRRAFDFVDNNPYDDAGYTSPSIGLAAQAIPVPAGLGILKLRLPNLPPLAGLIGEGLRFSGHEAVTKNVKEIKIAQQDLIDAVDKVKPRKKEAPIPQSIK